MASICCSTAARTRLISELAMSYFASTRRDVTTEMSAIPRMNMTTADATKIEPMTRTWSEVRHISLTRSYARLK